jgi:hypothetical protein
MVDTETAVRPNATQTIERSGIMGELIELHRFGRTRPVIPADAAGTDGASYPLPFLFWRSALAAWSTLWLAPFGLRVEPREAPARARRPDAA